MSEREPRSFPTNHISREALVSIKPDRQAGIDAFSDGQMEQIANDIGEGVGDAFWIAVSIVLARHLPPEDDSTNSDAAPDLNP